MQLRMMLSDVPNSRLAVLIELVVSRDHRLETEGLCFCSIEYLSPC